MRRCRHRPSRDITGSIARQPASAPAPHAAAAPPAAPAGNVHVVTPGETLMSISRRYHKPLKQIADANHIPPHQHLKIGDRIVIPGKVVAAAAPARAAGSAARGARRRGCQSPAAARAGCRTGSGSESHRGGHALGQLRRRGRVRRPPMAARRARRSAGRCAAG